MKGTDLRFAAVLLRIASATTAIRIRGEDAVRLERNGSSAELRERVEAVIERLEAVAADLESALA